MSTTNGFRVTRAAGSDWRDGALCTQFPAMWADRMWLYEDAAEDSRPDPALRTTARRVCAECPVRAECLASATIDSEQYGIRGGFRLRERKIAAELAEKDGLDVYSRTGAHRVDRFTAYLSWLREHGEIWELVPQLDKAGARRGKAKTAERAQHRAQPMHRRAHAAAQVRETIEKAAMPLLQDTLF